MRKTTTFLTLILVMFISANCSVNSDHQSPSVDSSVETSPDQLFADPTPAETKAEKVESTLKVAEEAPKQVDLETGHINMPESTPAPEVTKAPPPPSVNPEYKPGPATYEVKPSDTWMIIAQKLLGDPLRWKEIQRMNKKYKSSKELLPGTVLSYIAPAEPVVQPEGLPYLIKRHETLPKISNKVYGTKKSWDVIYFNNKDVIRNPNMIYSGFVLYYPEIEKIPAVREQIAAAHFDIYAKRKPASVKK